MSTVPPLTRAGAIQWARQSIDRLDARLLLEFVSGCTANALIADPDVALEALQQHRFISLVERRAAGEPLAYLVGQAGFYGDLLEVTSDVLVPRPETEDLVDWALEVLRAYKSPAILDLGTGSGAIALALAGARPDAQVTAVDVSPAALSVASGNRQRLDRSNVQLICGSWYQGLTKTDLFDLIVSNPSYIPANDPHLAGDGVRFEPRLALTNEADELGAYRAIAAGALAYLKPGGWLLVEHGHDQADAVGRIWAAAGLVNVTGRTDLSGNPRMTAGQKPEGLPL
ncbi:MAG: Peptide chain release factor N(5)-glutamine methyltransferase [Fluviibacter phosphoraccumulans EoVTN8]